MPAKFNLLIAASIPAVAIVPLLACGGSSSKPDAPIIVQHDAPGSGSNGSAVCSFPANFSPGAIAMNETFIDWAAIGEQINGAAAQENRIDMQAVVGGSNTDPKVQVLRVAMFGGCGTTGTNCSGGSGLPTPEWPAAFTPKSGLDLAGSDGTGLPDVFLELLTDVGSDNNFQTYYLSVAGTLNITAAQNGSGKTFAGNLQNGDFVHVDLGTSIQADPDGCESIVGSASWSGSSHQAAFNGKIGGFIIENANENDYKMREWLRHRTM